MAAAKTRRGAGRRARDAPARSPPLVQALIRSHRDLRELGVAHALVGGLAVSARAQPRTTRDVDLAVAVESDAAAERLVFELRGRGYLVEALVEQTRTHRLATARLLSPGTSATAVIVDLLFASSGVEPELVARADTLTILPGVALPVATVADLLALKVLARNDRTRPQDADDLRTLLEVATTADRAEVARTLALIQERGFGRGRRLLRLWDAALEVAPPRAGFRRRTPPR